MNNLMQIGAPPWTIDEVIGSIDEFSAFYADRPIKDNKGGMKAPHMFAVWFIARKLSPDLIVESGIWKGQSTWLFEKACPKAKLVAIDLNLKEREYISKNAVYSNRDFYEQDWSDVTDRSLAFFDDHQNAYKRLQQCQWFGFKHTMFEDNYPATQGDCYSLKKAFAGAGFEPLSSQKTAPYETVRIQPNEIDSHMLQRRLEVYYEFPPVFKSEKTRWGDEWNEETYPTPQALLARPTKPSHEVFYNEAVHYTWICYAKLR